MNEIDKIKETVRKTFKSIKEFNWAWSYLNEENNTWEQFECTECLKLEFDYQAYKISGNSYFKCSNILQGLVNFENFEMTVKGPSK